MRKHSFCSCLLCLLLCLLLIPCALAEEPDEESDDSVQDDSRRWVILACEYADVFEIPQGTVNVSEIYACTIGTLKIPASLTGWTEGMEYTSISRYEVDPENPAFCSVGGVMYSKDMTELIAYPQSAAAASFTVPAGVKKIGAYAFEDNENLVSVSLPLGLREIGRSAFRRCMSLVSVNIPLTVTAVAEYAFADCMFLERVSMSPRLKDGLSANVFDNCPLLSSSQTYQGGNGSVSSRDEISPEE